MEIKVRKIVALILCICLCVTAISAEAKTKKVTGKDGKYITWNYDKDTKTLTFSGKGPISDFEMDGHGSEPEWYVWNEQTEHIVVEEGITSVGGWCFQDFWKVKSVSLPESLQEIGENAFYDNKELTICNLPSNLKNIRAYAFFCCENLELSVLPSKLEKLGEYAFCGCNKIKTFSFSKNTKKVTKGILSECKLLSKINMSKNTEVISEYAFSYCPQIKKIKLPKNVRTVTMSAFIGTSLKKIMLPSKVQVIKNGSHGNKGLGNGYEVKKLRIIEIHTKKLKKIEKNSFGGLSRKAVIKVPKTKKKQYTKMLRKSGLSKKIKIKSL